ncbi:uncharacterized protein KY384_008932 [Bacidia gigantensis]|uniref:uncharacterized protein n=1 Tax=Bacidia gigantensis TaxID=2732470 RepID=UPI001D040CC9|nr:uncharacterized protein KY384_008932 [Bacidia gigantensis]KAG8525288.1 hypothetical protein KY384_008932 [Bacidia gigantensis]
MLRLYTPANEVSDLNVAQEFPTVLPFPPMHYRPSSADARQLLPQSLSDSLSSTVNNALLEAAATDLSKSGNRLVLDDSISKEIGPVIANTLSSGGLLRVSSYDGVRARPDYIHPSWEDQFQDIERSLLERIEHADIDDDDECMGDESSQSRRCVPPNQPQLTQDDLKVAMLRIQKIVINAPPIRVNDARVYGMQNFTGCPEQSFTAHIDNDIPPPVLSYLGDLDDSQILKKAPGSFKRYNLALRFDLTFFAAEPCMTGV